jgi:hypothetical protein
VLCKRRVELFLRLNRLKPNDLDRMQITAAVARRLRSALIGGGGDLCSVYNITK